MDLFTNLLGLSPLQMGEVSLEGAFCQKACIIKHHKSGGCLVGCICGLNISVISFLFSLHFG